MYKILIVEDDPALGRGLSLALQNDIRTCTAAVDCRSARELAQQTAFDLALVDVNLPDGSGLDLLCRFREIGTPPVILLTCNDLEIDIVTGFSLGAEDYITKPFSLAVLRARVDAALRRTHSAAVPSVFQPEDFHFDFAQMIFLAEGQPVLLSQTEQKLLRLLIENAGRILSRERLLSYIWQDGTEYVAENALSVAVGRLRRKLGEKAPIQTVYGIGYTWAVQ